MKQEIGEEITLGVNYTKNQREDTVKDQGSVTGERVSEVLEGSVS